MKKIIKILIYFISFIIQYGYMEAADVHWIDPLGYQKPSPIEIQLPNENITPSKYYIDLTIGKGTICSMQEPCGNLRSLIGKPGISGGPAYVYVKGKGRFFLYEDTFYGAEGKEIVIKPWGDSTAYFMSSFGDQTISGPNIHHVIIDGGEKMEIHFVSDVPDKYAMHIMANNVTIYRTQSYATKESGGSMLFAACDFTKCDHVRFINNEMYDCNFAAGYQCSAIYWGAGAGGGYAKAEVKNNIIRGMGGEGIEVNPRVTSDGMEISGNVIHDVGKSTCSGSWQCRPGITMSIQDGNGNNTTLIKNNRIWDTGSSCIWDRGGGNPRPLIEGNICFDYGKGSGDGGPNPQGISSYLNGGTAIVRNNYFYAPNGTKPFDQSRFITRNNACLSPQRCGSFSNIWSSRIFVSTNENSLNFLLPTVISKPLVSTK